MNYCTLERWFHDPRSWWIAGLGISIALLTWLGFGAFSISCCISSLFLGFNFAAWVTIDFNGEFLAPLVDYWVNKGNGASTNTLHTTSGTRRTMPWDGLEIPSTVNDSLENLLDQIVDKYVNNWYESGISRDRAFLSEIRYQIRFACSLFARRLLALDLPRIIVQDALPITALHLNRIIKIEDDMEEKSCLRSLVESRICEKLNDLHYCMGSRQNELNYLRQIADFLIPRFLDETRLAGRAYDDDSPAKTMGNKAPRSWPSQSARHFLRELIVNSFLLPILDIIANPDTINHLIILALDNHRGDDSHLARSYYVPFLKGLTDLTVENVPDSLLQLKLSEVLRDARQFSMFRLYLKDTRGPVNELNFLAEATRIHESMQKKAESSGQIAYDIWQLFGQFVHESAPDRIGFTSEIVEEYRLAVESNNLEELDRIIEKSFQVIYQRMQLEYVVPFCQSDSFLGYLCGSPPISVNELIDKPCVQRKSSIAERSFSLAQFRSRLRRAIASTSFDGFLDGDTDEGLIYSSDTAEVRNDRRQYFGSSIEKKECEKNVYDVSYEEIMPPTPSHSRSLPHLDLPIIDISASENDSYNISPASVISNADEDALNSCGALVEQPQSEPILIIDHDIKDMNQWRVTIPKITPTRDITTGRTIYSYVIEVERSEAKEHETKKWSIYRRFAEFYVLEAKLVEFHGDSLRFPSLPPRKAFVTKNRAFMEQHRLVFASFISSLSKQKVLHRSDLLFAFLTSPDEFRDSLLLSDLNPWKVVKKMPGKLSREKGQNLRPFLLNLLAKTLSPQEKVEFKENVEVSSDSSSLSSCSATCETFISNLYNSVFGNNCQHCTVAEETSGYCETWSKSAFDSILFIIYSVLPHSSNWVLNILASIRLLCRSTLDSLILALLRRVHSVAFCEANLVALIHIIQQALFCSDSSVATEQEKTLREELAKRRTLEFVQEEVPSHVIHVLGRKNIRTGVKKLIHVLQYARLNKQLSYVLLDVLISKLFPDDLS